MKMMVRELNYRHADFTTFLVNTDRWFYPVLLQMSEDASLHHAGEHETGVVMFLRPDLVKPAPHEDCNPDYEFDMLDLVQSRKLVPSGVWGYASKATPEKGKEFLEKGLQAAVTYVRSRLELVSELSGASD